MPSMPPLCKIPVWILFFSLAFGRSVFTVAYAQAVDDYTTRLENASTLQDFDRAFGSMIDQFRAGKLMFGDDDVIHIINITKEKPFADHVLPAVYGWAGTMFGNGRMEEAVAYFMESAFLYEKRNKKLAQALSCFEIALIQHKAGNLDEAEDYYAITLSLGNDSLDHRIKINCYNGFALIRRERQHYDSAMHDFRSAYRVALSQHDTAWMGILSGNIASIHLRMDNYDSSLYYYFKNLRLIKRTNEVENEIETYAHLGKVFIRKKNDRMALQFLDSAMNVIRSKKILFNDFFNPMDEINETYAHVYAQRGDYKKAFDYYNQFHQVAQDKQRQLNGRSLKQLQSTYAFKQKQNELDLLQQINEANIVIIRQQKYTQIAFGAVIVLMSAIAFIAFQTGRQRKKLNQELSHSNDELGRLNTIKDKLFSVISHDLRGPLANLKSILELLNDGHLHQEEFHKLSGKLSHQLETSGSALENLLQWAKSQLSDIKSEPVKLRLGDMVDKVIMQFREELEAKKIHSKNSVEPDVRAWADFNQVEIILRNLIGNAIKFTPEGGIIQISGRSSTEFIYISIDDNGIGMSDAQIKNLFQPGKHFSNPGTNQEKGTGIGLIITNEMVMNNGGTITVSSTPYKGTTFTFSLPALAAEQVN